MVTTPNAVTAHNSVRPAFCNGGCRCTRTSPTSTATPAAARPSASPAPSGPPAECPRYAGKIAVTLPSNTANMSSVMLPKTTSPPINKFQPSRHMFQDLLLPRRRPVMRLHQHQQHQVRRTPPRWPRIHRRPAGGLPAPAPISPGPPPPRSGTTCCPTSPPG